MTSLVDTVTGLRYGNGLSFEPGLGSAGLTNGDSQTDSVVFAGAGLLSARVNQRLVASARFAGSGSLSAAPS